MPTLDLDDDFFLDDGETTLDDDSTGADARFAVDDDLFSEFPNGFAATEELHGEFDGDLRRGLMARIATAGAIKG
jgi:hypothetical protein